jgi:hypothetical protein
MGMHINSFKNVRSRKSETRGYDLACRFQLIKMTSSADHYSKILDDFNDFGVSVFHHQMKIVIFTSFHLKFSYFLIYIFIVM